MSNKKELNPRQLDEVNGGIIDSMQKPVFVEPENNDQLFIPEDFVLPVSASDSQLASGEILAAVIARRNEPTTNRNNGLRRRRPIGSRPRVKRDPLA